MWTPLKFREKKYRQDALRYIGHTCMEIVIGATFIATCASAETKKGEWLVRLAIDHPSKEQLSQLFATKIDGIEHLHDNLFKITSHDKNANIKKSITAEAEDIITSIQPNFVYRIQLVPPKIPKNMPFTKSPEHNLDNNKGDPEVITNNQPTRDGPDPRLEAQWSHNNTHAKDAWQIERGSSDIVVAVIDTGVDYNHEDISANIWHNDKEIPGNGIDDDHNGFVDDVIGWDFVDNDALPYDRMSSPRALGNPGHGTHCSGVIAAVGHNSIGVSGVAPQVKVMPLRFISENGQGTSDAAVKAIRYAVNNGAKIISNSWGGEAADGEDDHELKSALLDAQNAGVLLVFAAGNGRQNVGYDNDHDPKPALPASYDLDAIISVAAIDQNDQIGPFSNYGRKSVDIGAPGVKVLSTVPKNGYEDRVPLFGIPVGDWSGTSMAAPHVAGAAALVLAKNPGLTGIQIKKRLLESARPIAALKDKVLTGGTLDILKALE